MYLERLHVKNYRSLGDVEVKFIPKGVIVVDGINRDVDGGSNAAGKTSLLSSIPFAFFGRPLEGGTISDYVQYGKSDLLIEVDLRVNKHKFTIKRTLSDFDLIVDGESLKGLKSSLTKEFTYRTGLTYQTLKALFLGQAWESFVDMTPAKRVDSLENVFSIFVFDDLLKKFKKYKEKFESELIELEKQKSHIEGILSATKQSYSDKIDEFERKRKELITKIDYQLNQLKIELNVLQDKLSDNNDLPSLEDLDKKIILLEKKQDQINQEFLALEGEYKTVKSELSHLRNQLDRIRYELHKLKSNICPTCNRPLDAPTLVSQKKHEETRLVNKAKELSSRLDEIKYQYSVIVGQKGSIGDELAVLKNKRSALQHEIISKQGIKNKISGIKEKIDSLLAERRRILQEENPYLSLEEERKRRFDQASKEYMRVMKKINNKKKFIDYCGIWIDIVKKARSYLFTEMLTLLEKKANEYLDFLYPDLRIKFVYRDGKLLLVPFKSQRETNFKLLSGGEQQVTRLSCLLGLFETVRVRLLGSIGFLVLDEPLQHLDAVKRSKFFSLVKQLGKDLQIIIIDHHQDFGSDVDQYILLEKSNGITRVKEIICEA